MKTAIFGYCGGLEMRLLLGNTIRYALWTFAICQLLGMSAVQAQNFPCRVSNEEIVRKANLLQAATRGDRTAQMHYNQLVQGHAERLRQCRQTHWPRAQAVWLRVYPCDLKPGRLEQLLDNITNFGYNRIYLSTFYDGRVLLPKRDNPTVWPSVVESTANNNDLLAQAIAKSHSRGITVYAWLFSMNFGAGYAKRADRQGAIARNGYGETNLQDPAGIPDEGRAAHIYVDPYSTQARADLSLLVQQVAQRRPDGIVFDYIRYPHRAESVVSDVRDLMIYGSSSAKTLLTRAISQRGQDLIYQYMQKGQVRDQATDAELPLWYSPEEAHPQRQEIKLGRNLKSVNQELWRLSVSHAHRGVIEFLDSVSLPAHQLGITTGAVFFPKANLNSSRGVDPRLQPWHQFKNVSEWAPMNYAICGSADCLINELGLVMKQANGSQTICPVIAGYWGRSEGSRLSLEAQMYALHGAYPQINCISHFAYAWFDRDGDRQRRSCRLD
jgi:hypothetical protein